MSRESKVPPARVSAEQLRYAQMLNAGMRAGLLILIAGFMVYVLQLIPAHIAFDRLPQLWTLSASDYLRETGAAEGWGWIMKLDHGETLSIAGIALLASISLVCFAGLVPLFASRRDWPYCAIAVCEIAVLALAASGVLTAGH